MKLFLKARDGKYDAKATYDAKKEFVVKKGSKVSQAVSESEKFRSRNSVLKMREEYVKDGVVIKDVVLKSSSTAANFVTGSSTNGMLAWKDEDGNTLKKIIEQS